MEEATRQTHHPHLRHQDNRIYLVLGIIIILPMLWQELGSDKVAKWHPFFDVEYSLYWYVALTMYNIKPLLYVIVAILAKSKHRLLLTIFIGYEFILFMDHILIYSQSPGITISGIILALYMVWYHYKYEPHR